MAKVYDKSISPSCSYCQFGRLSPDKEGILCIQQGIMLPSSSCKKFKYDPLKRQPKQKPKLFTGYNPEDFVL